MLKFFGKGSAFADDNTCAYFKDGKDMILIDFSLEAFPKFRKIDFDGIETIYILITHTHGDHISGIGTLIHYAYFIYFEIARHYCQPYAQNYGTHDIFA